MIVGENMFIAAIGNFGKKNDSVNGQTVKTTAIYEELIKHFGRENIMKINTAVLNRKPISLIHQIIKAFNNSTNIIFLPADRAIKYFVPLFYILNFIYKRRLHYVVVGGWIGKFLEKKKLYKKMVNTFYMVYCETSVIRNELIELGLNNNTILPNFKHIDVLDVDTDYSISEPYKVCTFSRVTKRKGIQDAIDAVKIINEKHGRIRIVLDVFGPVEENFFDEFDKAIKQNGSFCKYLGSIDPNQAVSVLQNYFLMIFPTRIRTEGHPGSIIDSFSAGVPVLSADWESSKDLINDDTGYLYEMGNVEDLVDSLNQILDDPMSVLKKKEHCLKKAKEFDASNALKVLISNLKS